MSEIADRIAWADFQKVDIRVGTVLTAEPLEKARKPAYVLTVDFGETIGSRKTSARITAHYTPDRLVGRKVAAVLNFPPRQIANVTSGILVLGFPDEDGEVVLVGVDRDVPDGGRLF